MKASIVIPNLNGAGWLRDSIESIWAQTEQDFELIIIDNGSTDESLAIARSYVGRPGYTLRKSTRLVWFRTGRLLGGSAGFAGSQGRFAGCRYLRSFAA